MDRDKASYADMLAVLEAKKGDSEQDFKDAFEQLYLYTRQTYQMQHNLRFAWGLTVCGRKVCVIHFGPDRATASPIIDVGTPEGRQALIGLFVNCALCEYAQLGRDPTIRRLDSLNCWEIDCPDDTGDTTGGTVVKYYYSKVYFAADRVFGRHTRCFLAASKMPTVAVSESNPLIPDIIVKDAWAYAHRIPAKDIRDEVKGLRSIDSEFPEGVDTGFIVPRIKAGGRVYFELNGKRVEDNTDTMYGKPPELVEDNTDTMDERPTEPVVDNGDTRYKNLYDPCLFRTHRRIATSPIGEPLAEVKSIAEFVTVVCDVMVFHYELVRR
ncbi:hypothetical protein IWW38_005795, partial [Coemansia aciculifera]